MSYSIYTFGNGEILKGVFDAIAMCLNEQNGTLFTALKHLGLIMGTFWAAVYALFGDHLKVFTSWIIPMTVMMNLLFIPSTSVWIHDPVTHYHQKVDHVPYGLAAFAGYVSKIGYLMTEQVEKIFTLPDDLKYQKTGHLFASTLIQQARTFHITNDAMAENMRSFVSQCIVYDAMLGRKYTLEDLRHSDDIWGLVSAQPSPVRSLVYRDSKEQSESRPSIITCKEAVKRFNQLWNQELSQSATLFGKKVFGKNGLINPKTELLKYLPLSYSTLGDMAKSATEILKQNMMIYAVVEGVESQSVALGNTPNFAARRAYLQQRSTYETLGVMAGETLPTMKAVLEAIAYSCFLFVIPMALLPFGWRVLLSWGQILLWLQMWAPLYAILNYIMTMAARSKTLSGLSLSNEAGVTIASSVGITNLNADMTAMAGYLAMSIPFLCIALVKGVGSFVHMASHLGNVSQSAANLAAGEVTSGNFNYGNISEGNRQIGNTHMLSQSMSAQYRANSFQFADGRADMTTMADGSQVVNMSTSNLPINLNVAETQSAQLSQMSSQSYQNALSQSQSSAQNLASSYRDMVDLNHAMSHGEHRGDGVSQGVHTEQTRAIQKSAQMIEDFAKQNNISTQKSAEFLGAASVGGGILLKGSMGVSGAISSSDQDLLSKAQRFSESSDFQSSMREAAQASQNLSHTLNDDTSKRLSEGISGSYERGNTLRDEASKSFRASQDYAKQAMETQASASSINANYNQEFLDWLSDQPSDHGPGSREGGGRIGKQGAAHIIANDPGGRMAYAQRFMEVKGLNPSPSIKMMAPSDLKESYNNETGHNLYPVISQDKDQIREKASLEFDPRSHEENKRFRQEVGETIKDRQGHIHKERKLQKKLLSPIDESINRESGKSVVGRVMKKAESEALQVGTEVVQGAKSLGKKVMKNLLGKTTKE